MNSHANSNAMEHMSPPNTVERVRPYAPPGGFEGGENDHDKENFPALHHSKRKSPEAKTIGSTDSMDSKTKKQKQKTSGKMPQRKSLRELKYLSFSQPQWSVMYEGPWPLKLADGTKASWAFSEKGHGYFTHMEDEAQKRDPDNHGVYFSNDFAGYGFLEVVENEVTAWTKEFRKARSRAEELFFHAEALSMFLNSDWYCQWMQIDDGSRARAMMAVLSTMFCETFLRLQADNLLQPASPLKNTGLVAALLVRWTPEFPNQHGRERLREVVQLCRDNNIELSLGPKEIDEEVEEHLERLGKPPTHMATDWLDEHPEEDDDKIQDPEERKKIQDRRFFIECATGSWYKKPAKARKQAATSDDEWTDEDEDSPAGFEKELGKYLAESTTGGSKLGGKKFDITRMSKAQRERAEGDTMFM